MQRQQVFGTTVLTVPCRDRSLWHSNEILETVQALIRDPVFDGRVPEQQGEARSTVMNLRLGQIAHIDCLQPLMQWIHNTIWQHRGEFGKTHCQSLRLGRNWANEMQRGCRGVLHQHYTHVAVFYLRVPEQGADMQFEQGDQQILAGAREGDLLIHEPLLWHSVTEHNSDITRICLVIEFEFV